MGTRVWWVFPGYKPLRLLRFFWAFIYGRYISGNDDVILIHKVYSQGLYFRLLQHLIRNTRAKIIYDIDDAEWWRQPKEGMDKLMQLSDQIHVGSTCLKSQLSHFQKPVVHLTSSVQPPHHRYAGPSKTFHLGWVGGYNSQEPSPPYSHKHAILTMLLPALSDLPFPIELTLLGPALAHDIEELEDWAARQTNQVVLHLPRITNWGDEAAIDAIISEWDLGIALMIDHPFNHAKSAFKAKQCMNCGVPVIGNRVGDNTLYIQDKRTGYLADHVEAVRQAILDHHALPQARKMTMSQACLEESKCFHISTYAEAFMSAVLTEENTTSMLLTH